MLPDTSDPEKMAHIGRMTVLRKARRAAAQKLRDRVVPLLNSMDEKEWDVSGIISLIEEITEINAAIQEIN